MAYIRRALAKRFSTLASRSGAALGMALALAASCADAQSAYPAKPVRIVVPAPAGGPTDVAGRLLAQKLTEMWGQTAFIENRAGADGEIGTAAVAQAAPDGYTLLMLVDSTVTMLPFAKKKLSYGPAALTPITTIDEAALLLVSSTKFGARNFAEAVSLAKAQPGKVNMGIGTFTSRLVAARIQSLSGTKFNQIPFKGSGESTQALLGQELDLLLSGYSALKANVNTGKFRILATTGTKRFPALPDVPTFGELGLSGFDSGLWAGLAAPAGTPAAIINKVQVDMNKVLDMPDVKEKLIGLALIPMPGTPASMAELIRNDQAKWKKTIEEAGLSLD